MKKTLLKAYIPAANVTPYKHYSAQNQVTKVAPEDHSEEIEANIPRDALEDALRKVNNSLYATNISSQLHNFYLTE